jgi:SAM-dependent methyltransferase
MHIDICPLCSSRSLERIIDLGMHPLADTFIKKEDVGNEEPRYPLQMLLCTECGHAMNAYRVPPEQRYQKSEYSYDSSNSKASIEHFSEMARDIIARVPVASGDLVVDIGGNVGTLLMAFRDQVGAEILNIEPSGNIAALAEQNGVRTINDFLSEETGKAITELGGAKAITLTNVFNHLDYLDESMQTMADALAPGGAIVIETPYLLHLVEKLAFDTIYLEHVSYFAIRPLRAYFKKFGLTITALEENDYMGGSIRLFVMKEGTEGPEVAACIEREEAARLYETAMYADFMCKVEDFKRRLLDDLTAAKAQGGRIVGIGAATKGNTLLNYCGIDASLLEFVTDASPLKIGKYTPGSHIPIVPDEAITDEITHGLILPWNIAQFLTGKLAPRYPYLAFIVPHMGE